MVLKGRALVTGIIVAAVLVVVAVGLAVAQGQQGRGGRGPMMMGPVMMGPMMRGPMMGGMNAPVAIAVADGKVFVASGGKLYRFNAETLEKEMEAAYVQAPAGGGMPMRGGMGGGPPGFGPPAPGGQ